MRNEAAGVLQHGTTIRTVALVGNPNSGKTTLFNALTGLRHRVGNYPGVTVEKKEGRMRLPSGQMVTVLDLPGVYSLAPSSPDEEIAVDVLVGRQPSTPHPDLVVCVADATNLERNLYLLTQIVDRQIPVILALNMMDIVQAEGIRIDTDLLTQEMGIPVVPVAATRSVGLDELKRAIEQTGAPSGRILMGNLPPLAEREYRELGELLQRHEGFSRPLAMHEAARLLSLETIGRSDRLAFRPALLEHVRKDHEKLDFLGIERPAMFVGTRYEWIRNLCRRAVQHPLPKGVAFTDRMDRVVTHRVFGPIIFLALMGLMFQSIFSWATVPMNLIADGSDWLGTQIVALMPPGDLRDLLVKGALAGVSAVVTFLPQIVFLFLFLGVLEDSGYMARAAFLMDKLMSRVGLHGKSFIPLLGSFACAIPGIMATRTIETPRDRLATMLVAPLMSCSARLPVYSLLIAAFIPPTMVLGVVSLPALILLSLYLLGMVAALVVAMLFKKTLLRGTPAAFILELPPYRIPSVRTVLSQVLEKALSFLKTAGTIILGASIILWFLATYPKSDAATSADRLQESYAGTLGKLIEPALRPLGFDWKIGIGLVTSVLQRESFVSAMATIYNIESDEEGTLPLHRALREDIDPATGVPSFTLLTALCLMVYYVLAMQCLSTVAVMRRETGGWKWPVVQIAYMTVLAYGTTFVVYRAGLWIGLGG